MTGSLLTYRGSVYPWHCDHMGHMNVMHYTGKFDEATWNLFSEVGMTSGYLKDNNRGMAALDQTTKYMRELLPGDTVKIYTEILKFSDKILEIEHAMIDNNSGEVAATTRIVGVYLDTRLRKSCPFDDNIMKNIQDFVDGS